MKIFVEFYLVEVLFPTGMAGAFHGGRTCFIWFESTLGLLGLHYCTEKLSNCPQPCMLSRVPSQDWNPGPHCPENPIFVFPEMKLLGHILNSYIYVSVSDLHIPRISLLFGCSK
jgi:hypothetical protein